MLGTNPLPVILVPYAFEESFTFIDRPEHLQPVTLKNSRNSTIGNGLFETIQVPCIPGFAHSRLQFFLLLGCEFSLQAPNMPFFASEVIDNIAVPCCFPLVAHTVLLFMNLIQYRIDHGYC